MPELTKKQRKGLAFRQRKKGTKTSENELTAGDIPIQENIDENIQDEHANTDDQPAHSSPNKTEDQGKGSSSSSSKRKRSDGEASAPSPKKRKKQVESIDDADEASLPKAEKLASKEQQQQQNHRFILFVGNLKYTTSKEAISKHFSACDPPPDVRLLTQKSAGAGKATATAKSKGCAFLEFTHRNALQQALKLHQSELDGRKINVELTAGGGGKSEKRLEKLKTRNRDLASQRTKRAQKESKAEGGTGDVQPEKPQRHSTTSGLEQAPTKMRTWTIPEGGDDDDGKTHRGGKKHAKGEQKKRGKRPQSQGTGVNAIPVG